MNNLIIIEQLIFLLVLIATGWVAARAGIITESVRDGLVKIIFNITLPLLLFTNFSNLDLTPQILSNSLIVILISFLSIVMMMLSGTLFARLFKSSEEERSVFIVHNAFGNILYFGFPVIDALFGEIGLFYASIYTFVSIMMLWTAGVWVFTRGGSPDVKTRLKSMFNPNSVAIIAGFILFVIDIRIPGFLLKPFQSLGGTTTYLSMLYIGALLGLMKVRGVFGNRLVWITTFNKNLLYPVIILFATVLITRTFFPATDKLLLSVVILEAAMPCMANIVIVARIFNADEKLATANLFVSTLVSMATLPLIYLLITLFI